MRCPRGWPTFLIVGGLALVLDLATKEAIFAQLGMPGMGRRIEFVGQGLSWLFAAVSVAALAGILALVARPATRQSRWLVVSLALICGGIVGNLYDRLGLPGLEWHAPLERLGQPVYAVRDWIHVTVPGVIDWPIFNLADSWLVIGAGMLLLSSFWQPTADNGPADEGRRDGP